MEPTLSPSAAQAICAHMNDDHADAIAGYARAFANIADVRSAEMIGIDERAMRLRVETAAGTIETHVVFDHPLADAADARETLVAMARRAMTDA